MKQALRFVRSIQQASIWERNRIWLLPLLLTCAFGLCVDIPALGQQEPDSIKNGVVKVTVHLDGGGTSRGTGFVVQLSSGVAYIVTASHVVNDGGDVDIETFGHPGQVTVAKTVYKEGKKLSRVGPVDSRT